MMMKFTISIGLQVKLLAIFRSNLFWGEVNGQLAINTKGALNLQTAQAIGVHRATVHQAIDRSSKIGLSRKQEQACGSVARLK